jgi:hypothetical protein
LLGVVEGDGGRDAVGEGGVQRLLVSVVEEGGVNGSVGGLIGGLGGGCVRGLVLIGQGCQVIR